MFEMNAFPSFRLKRTTMSLCYAGKALTHSCVFMLVVPCSHCTLAHLPQNTDVTVQHECSKWGVRGGINDM